MSRPMTEGSQLHPGCGCTSHQPIYRHWPRENVTIRVSSCMYVCPYCGHVFSNASRLRKHFGQKKYRERNILVEPERVGAPLLFWYGGSLLTNSRSPRRLPRTFGLPSGNNAPIAPSPERQVNWSSQTIDLFPHKSCEAMLKEFWKKSVRTSRFVRYQTRQPWMVCQRRPDRFGYLQLLLFHNFLTLPKLARPCASRP